MNQRQLFLNSVAQTSSAPMAIEIRKAKGCYLIGKNGKRYLDLISGIAVSSLGHGNQSVINAITKQARTYMHTMVYGEHIQAPQVQLAQKLKKLLPSKLDSVYFVNSGSEAIEGAMKLAKRYTGRNGFVACSKSYHGSSQGAMSLMDDDFFAAKYRPLLPNISFLDQHHTNLECINSDTAAVVLEVVQAEKGVYVTNPEWLKKVSERCTEVGALLIFDEIQTGMGRTGTWFAFEQTEVVPDILVLAKSLGAGLPLGCFISSSQIMETLQSNPPLGHITTFGGNPVSCAGALAGIKWMLKAKLIDDVKAKSELFLKLLKHPLIKEVRGKGLMLAIDFKDSTLNHQIIDRCIERGLHVDWFLYNEESMRICPPLIINEKLITKACKIILEVCSEFGN